MNVPFFRGSSKLWLFLVVAGVLLVPASAQAQVRGVRWGGWGGFGPWGYGAGGPWGYGFGAFGGGGFSYGASWAYASPLYRQGYGRSEPVLVILSDPPRARVTFYPAIVLPPPEVIAAALDDGDDGRARIEVLVPAAAAQVYFDDVLTRQKGTERLFVTPQLNTGKDYAFKVRVVWSDDQGRHDVSREVAIRAGDSKRLDFRKLTGKK